MKVNLKKLIEFETKYNLIDRKVLDENYWEYCRSTFFYEIITLSKEINHVVNVNKKITHNERQIFLKQINKYFFSSKRNTDILFIADPRRILQNNQFKQTFIDDIAESINDEYKIMTIEEPNWKAWNYGMPPHLIPNFTINLKYTDIYELLFLLKLKFYKIYKKEELKAIKKEFNYLKNIVNSFFKIDISKKEKEFIDLIFYFKYMKIKYKKLIKKINPKLVIINYRPTYFKNLMTIICNEIGITTIELQHGIISSDDPLDKKNPNGSLYKTRANYLFAFGKKLVNEEYLSFNQSEIKYVGYPYLENKKAEKIAKPNFIKKNYKYIIIISQSIIGNQFATFASDLSDYLKNYPQYKIIFKYHPNELEKDYSQLKKDNIIEIKSMKYDLFQLQNHCICQIGSYSTGLYEGLSLQLPTIIIKNFVGANSTIRNLINFKQGIYVIKNASDVLKILKKIKQPLKTDTAQLWKNNSINNIKKEINKIIIDTKK